MLRGRSEPLRAYEPLAEAVFKGPATTQYSEAFAKLEAGNGAAMPAFERLWACMPAMNLLAFTSDVAERS
jgi:hypothetical protein